MITFIWTLQFCKLPYGISFWVCLWARVGIALNGKSTGSTNWFLLWSFVINLDVQTLLQHECFSSSDSPTLGQRSLSILSGTNSLHVNAKSAIYQCILQTAATFPPYLFLHLPPMEITCYFSAPSTCRLGLIRLNLPLSQCTLALIFSWHR